MNPVLATMTILWAAAGAPDGASVVVFPLDARGVAIETAEQATEQMATAVGKLPGIRALRPSAFEKKLGVPLSNQAKECEYDVFCLVEVGEILQAEKILIGHVRRRPPEESEKEDVVELKVVILDVIKAAITEALVLRMPASDQRALDDAIQVAARRLLRPPNARVTFDLEPHDAKVSFYGEPIMVPAKGDSMPYWSGAYRMSVEAKGYHSQDVRIVIPSKKSVTKIRLVLEQDPLWVASSSGPDRKKSEPFDKTSRREGSGISVMDAGAVEVERDDRSFVAKAAPWALAATGVGVSVAGVFVMRSAQVSYNELSGQERYSPGKTVTAAVAAKRRDDARSEHRIGSVIFLTGLAVAAGAVVWIILDASSGPGKHETVARAQSDRGDGLWQPDPAVRAVVAELARAATVGGAP